MANTSLHVHVDELTRRLYANDASMYEEVPAAVAFPRNVADVQDLLRVARTNGWPITARTAGTSLAGQATGGGLVADFSRHMNAIVAIDADRRTARVQPGVIRDTLNRAAARCGLHFAPDTATTSRCMIGGMIGNNSAGMYSVKHGSTRDHVSRVRAVLADGSLVEFGPLQSDELSAKCAQTDTEGRIYRELCALLTSHSELIRRSYPHRAIRRRNTGYALDRLLEMEPFTPGGRPFNVAEFLCGSEGTLALTVEAEVKLKPLPRHRVLLFPHFATVDDAVAAAVAAVESGCAAAELLDERVLQAALQNSEQRRNAHFIQGQPGALLLVEWQDDEHTGEAGTRAKVFQQIVLSGGGAYAAPLLDAADVMARAWELRKAGLGVLMGLWQDKRTPEFMEDTAVRVGDLPAYVKEVRALMARYGTSCVYYGHASVGELHLRPELDLTTAEGRATMVAMAGDVADLVKAFGGSLSGEHGDGRVRAPYIERVLGAAMMPVLAQVKRIWDPEGLLNPGKVVHAVPMDEHLRVGHARAVDPVQTAFKWRDQHGFRHAIERCNGAGVCRKLAASGGTMCPSYHVTREEKDSTRGRANLFRQLFRGQARNAFASHDLKEALEYCLSCKACKSECPASVDMARMKAEFLHGWHQAHGTTRSERLFASPEKWIERMARWPRLARGGLVQRLGAPIMKWLYGIHPDRTLPRLADEPFHVWFARRPARTEWDRETPVLLITDYYMNYFEPWIGRAMVEVFEALGCRVRITPPRSVGRAAISLGFLDEAKALLSAAVREWSTEDAVIVGPEPSDVLTLRDEALDLLEDDDLASAHKVAARAKLFEEFVVERIRGLSGNPFDAQQRPVHVHGHCHVKALVGMDPLMTCLRLAGYAPNDMGTGCCGLAGHFGYTRDHYPLSMQVGELSLLPAVRELDAAALVCAPGLSCRHQISDGAGRRAWHPAELLARARVS